jgi:DNA-binding HxlR family transcriptional regulator
MSEGELESGRVMKVINHPVRMRIIELLATKGPLSWKELSGDLGIRTGALYHHLDTLERIVTRNPEKKYVLTRFGQEIYANVSANPSLGSQNIERAMKRRSVSGVLQSVFVPRSLIFAWASTRTKAVLSSFVVSALVLASLIAADSEMVLYSFSSSGGFLVSVFSYLGSIAIVVALTALSIRSIFKQKSDIATLASSVALSFLPLAVFGLIVHNLYDSGALGTLGDRTILTIAFAFFQAWGAGIVGAGMSVASGLRIEKTLVLSLVLLYATMVIVLAQGGVLA